MRYADRVPNQKHVLEALGGKRVLPTLGSTDCALHLFHSAKLIVSFSRYVSYATGMATYFCYMFHHA